MCALAISSSLTACKLDSLSIRTLRIRTNTATGPLVTMPVGTPSYVASDQDLATVRALCAGGLTAEVDAPNPRKARIAPTTTLDVSLFGRRPNEMHDFLARLDEPAITAALQATTAQRSAGVWHAGTASPSGFPETSTISTSSTGTIGPTATRGLTGALFWGTGAPWPGLSPELTTCQRAAGGPTIAGGSVQAVVAYSRGACSREVSYRELVADGNRTLTDEIRAAARGGIGSNTITYSILHSYLRHAGGTFDAPAGGLFLFLHVVSRDRLGHAPSATWAKVRYELALSARRVLEIRPAQLGWRHDEGWGRILSEGLPGVVPGLRVALTAPDGELVTTLQQQLLEQQLVGVQSDAVAAVLASPEFDCDPRDHVPACTKAASALAGALGALIQAREDPAQPARSLFTAAEVDRMRCAIGDPASCGRIGKDAGAIVRDRWVCTKSRRFPVQNHCDLSVPTSRLLPTPSGLISVFFDEDELDNAAYAIEAASPGALCAPAAPPASRRFLSDVIEDGRHRS